MLKSLSYKGRSVWKSFFFEQNNEIMLRNKIFLKKDINKIKLIHNGKKYQAIKVNPRMKNLKAGQFVLTKKIGAKIHSVKKKRKKKK